MGIYTEFPNNESWRFVDANFEFTDAMHPWPFNESITMETTPGVDISENFMAVKVGDLNNTVVSNSTQVTTRDARPTMELQIDDRDVKVGERIEVPVRIENMESLLGFQFTMELGETQNSFGERRGMLKYKAVLPGKIDVSDQHIGVFKNKITASFATNIAIESSEEPLFTLIFEVKENGLLSEMLTITSDITDAEAYDANEVIFDIEIDFNSTLIADGENFALHQNEPNPFVDVTSIGFTLPREMGATLRIYDAAGKVVKEIKGDYKAGYNKVQLARNDLQAGGVYYYHLTAGEFKASKKLVASK